MTRLIAPILTLALLLLSTGCGNVFIRGAIETGSAIQGSVSIVQLETVGSIQVTLVTLLQNGEAFTIGFCGDQSALFPLDRTVRVDFNPGQRCATVIVVAIVV